ncbi:hypothetical protein LTR84_011724 [Exophiala bonariae]|uniref:J domain-containing protein n=1 Tax=Exophiala bonariae TaxID=1690606 RepID=A0AAV9NJA5_9EURO|nr:hypothetical protein LTR84_011724 [Exophiala bonariae]
MADQTRDRCHYTTLGVNKTATSAEIKKSYSKLVLIHHPDKGGKQEMFVKIQEAYETLRDPVLRKAYDSKQQAASFREAKKAEAAFGTDFEPDFKTKPGQPPSGRADQPRKESAAQRRQREEERRAEARQGKSFFKERQPRPDPDFAQRRARADSFFENGPSSTDNSFFDDDYFEAQNFGRFNAHTADYPHHTDKNRKEPQARERGQYDHPREEASPRYPKEAKAHGHAFHEADIEILTFESLLARAEHRHKHFSDMFSKLRATIGPHFSRRMYNDVWCHLQHIKDLLAKRVISIELAQSNHALKEFRQGLKEGTLKPSKDTISSILSKLNSDYCYLKGTEELMFDAFELAENLSDRMERNNGVKTAPYTVRKDLTDRAMIALQQHVKKCLFK